MTHPDPGSCSELPFGVGRAATACGDALEFHLWLEEDRVSRIEFAMRGCTNTYAAGVAAVRFARGRPLPDLVGAGPADLLPLAEGLAPGTEHVAELAVDALREAAIDALRNLRDPWKRLYRPRD